MVLAYLLSRRFLNPRFTRVKLVIKMGAFLKTEMVETRRKAGEADCGSGKALSPYLRQMGGHGMSALNKRLMMIDWWISTRT